jgi:hypothetical protein
MLAPFVAYFAWVAVLRIRLGVTPFGARSNRLSSPPLSGLADEWTRFAEPARAWLWLLVAVGIIIVALVRRDRDPLAWVVLAIGVFGAFMGPAVWARWQDFSRPLLPLYAYGPLVVITLITEMMAPPNPPTAATRVAVPA